MQRSRWERRDGKHHEKELKSNEKRKQKEGHSKLHLNHIKYSKWWDDENAYEKIASERKLNNFDRMVNFHFSNKNRHIILAFTFNMVS